MSMPSTDQLLQGMRHGTASLQRRAMAKAITLLESTRADHRALADELLTAMLPHTGNSFRLGISGKSHGIHDLAHQALGFGCHSSNVGGALLGHLEGDVRNTVVKHVESEGRRGFGVRGVQWGTG